MYASATNANLHIMPRVPVRVTVLKGGTSHFAYQLRVHGIPPHFSKPHIHWAVFACMLVRTEAFQEASTTPYRSRFKRRKSQNGRGMSIGRPIAAACHCQSVKKILNRARLMTLVPNPILYLRTLRLLSLCGSTCGQQWLQSQPSTTQVVPRASI